LPTAAACTRLLPTDKSSGAFSHGRTGSRPITAPGPADRCECAASGRSLSLICGRADELNRSVPCTCSFKRHAIRYVVSLTVVIRRRTLRRCDTHVARAGSVSGLADSGSEILMRSLAFSVHPLRACDTVCVAPLGELRYPLNGIKISIQLQWILSRLGPVF